MSENEQANPYRISKNRLETIVDAIFAFAMTLLVLGIDAPRFDTVEAATRLTPYVQKLVPQIVIFVIAFFVLAHFWLEHHRQFHYVRLVNPTLLWLNIIMLISIVLIPFTTNLAGDYMGAQIAVLLFHLDFLVIGLLFLVHWKYLSYAHNLSSTGLDPMTAAQRFRMLSAMPACAILGIALSFFSPPASFIPYIIIPVIIIINRRSSVDMGQAV
jgi:uncharacterized membrane protein